MPPEKHALLGASSAERWLMCPPSARLGEQFPDTASEYAAAGTLAHAIAELKARKYFVEPMSNRPLSPRQQPPPRPPRPPARSPSRSPDWRARRASTMCGRS